MDIAILTPVEIEYIVVRQFLIDLTSQEYGGFEYELGRFSGMHYDYSIVINQTGSRIEDISLSTERVIRNFKPAIVILLGIAGGVKDVEIGDVVVGLKAYGYESSKETPDGLEMRPDVIPYDLQLIEKARLIARSQRWHKRIRIGEKAGKVVFGPIASGNKLIASTKSLTFGTLKKYFNDTTALEMEAIGFAKAVLPYRDVRAMNIRGISDMLDNKSSSDLEGKQELATHMAAAFAFELLYQLDFLNLKIYALNMKDLIDKLTTLAVPLLKREATDVANIKEDGVLLEMLWEKIRPLLTNRITLVKKLAEDDELINDLPVLVKNDLKLALSFDTSLKTELDGLIRSMEEIKREEDVRIENSKNIIYRSQIDVKGDFRLGDNHG